MRSLRASPPFLPHSLPVPMERLEPGPLHACSLAPPTSVLAGSEAGPLALQDHCHYHGHVRGFPDSWVVLSICSGMK